MNGIHDDAESLPSLRLAGDALSVGHHAGAKDPVRRVGWARWHAAPALAASKDRLDLCWRLVCVCRTSVRNVSR